MLKKSLNERIHLVEGNSKLEGADNVEFLIYNILSQVTCPYKTHICEFVCYAANEERRFPSVRKSRTENLQEAMKTSFVTDMINHIEYQLSRPKFKDKVIYFRIHSSGDFFSASYFEKWIAITDHFKDNKKIVFEAYTKSLPYVMEYLQEMEKTLDDINIVLIYSIMPDTEPENIEAAKHIGMKTFSAVPIGENVSRETFKCPGKCGKCGACYNKDNGINNISIEFHGSRAKSVEKRLGA